jgi:Helicase HerA, central domain/TraM recognition site of TraD and TraG
MFTLIKKAIKEFINDRRNKVYINIGKFTKGPLRGKKYKININYFKQHLYLLGATGSGKSGLMISIVTQIINNKLLIDGKAPLIVVIDPNSETSDKIATRIKDISNTIQLDIKYKSDSNSYEYDYYLGFNPLIVKSKDIKNEVDKQCRRLLEHFFEKNLKDDNYQIITAAQNLIKLAIYYNIDSKVKLTLTDLCNIEKNYQTFYTIAQSLEKYDKDLSIYFEGREDDKSLQRVSQRLASTLFDLSTKRLFESTGYDPVKHLNNNKNVLIPLTGFNDPALASTKKILCKMIFSKLFIEYQDYYELTKKLKRPTIVFVDEVAVLEIENFDEIIDQARKLNLFLVLATQREDQLSTELNNALKSTCGTKMYMRLKPNEQIKDEYVRIEGVATGGKTIGLYQHKQKNGSKKVRRDNKTYYEPIYEIIEKACLKTARYCEEYRSTMPTSNFGLIREVLDNTIQSKKDNLAKYLGLDVSDTENTEPKKSRKPSKSKANKSVSKDKADQSVYFEM